MWIPVWTNPAQEERTSTQPLGNTGSGALARASHVLWHVLIDHIRRHDGDIVGLRELIDEMVQTLLAVCPDEARSWSHLTELWSAPGATQPTDNTGAALRDITRNHWELERAMPDLDEGSLESSLRRLVMRWLIERHRATTSPEEAWFECSGGLLVLVRSEPSS